MSVLVAKEAPQFTAKAVMPDGTFKEISLSDYKGKYVILFFYPLDFTFVCPTEIIAFSDRNSEFADLDALHAYKKHPTYADVTSIVRPMRELRFAADIEI